MIRLSNQALLQVNGGGGGLSGALLNGFSRFFKMIHDIGESLGSSIRRLVSGNLCN
jgi:hypothetical protein